MIKLVLGVLAVIAAVVLGFYFYERAKFLEVAEERAKAVGEKVYETGAETEKAEGVDLKAE